MRKPGPGQKLLVCVPILSCKRDFLLIEASAPGVTQPRRCCIETQQFVAQSVLSADDEPQGRPDEEVFMC